MSLGFLPLHCKILPRFAKGNSEQKVHATATETHTFVINMFEVLFLALRCLVEPVTVSKTCLVVAIHCIGSCLRFLVDSFKGCRVHKLLANAALIEPAVH